MPCLNLLSRPSRSEKNMDRKVSNIEGMCIACILCLWRCAERSKRSGARVLLDGVGIARTA